MKITINNQVVEVEEHTTILNAAKKIGIHIPTLCHLELHEHGLVNNFASCRVCMVENNENGKLEPACKTEITEGMNINTNSLKAIMARRTNVELLLSNHPFDCLTCARNLDCELQTLASDLGIMELNYTGKKYNYEKDISSLAIIKEPNKCVMCRRCETMCNEVQTVGILSALHRGFDSNVLPAFNLDIADTSCTYCGQCVSVCPTAALTEVNVTDKVLRTLHDEKKHVIVQVAPAVRVALGEMFGGKSGDISTGKMVTALRTLGFDGVFDTNFGADLTIIEEATELIQRIENNDNLPMLTSCCPAWVKFIEHQFPDLTHIPSSAKSPHMMFGQIAKTYYADKLEIDPNNLVVVSVMPCVAKKAEANRQELHKQANSTVDLVITTRELGSMIKEAGIDYNKLDDSMFDSIMGESTGAAQIFGTTGGVIEAALRTVYEWMTEDDLEDVNFHELRGTEGIREATVNIRGKDYKIGIAHGLGNARKILEGIEEGTSEYDAIEIMACPFGCIGGGGQPYHMGDLDILRERQKAIYEIDAGKEIRKSHENPMVQKLYEEYLGHPGSKKAHDLLHTYYEKKERI